MMHNGRWHERQWQRIADEYDEHPREVVRGYHHDMHIPICLIAELLCVSEKTLRLWCRSWSLPTRKTGLVIRCSESAVGRRVHAMGYDDIGQAIADLRASGLRWVDIQATLCCSSSTISRHIELTTKGRYCLTLSGRERKRAVMQALNAARPAGRKWGQLCNSR
jgi:hypothetical protein